MDTLFDLPLVREDNILRRFEEIHDFIYAHDGLSPQETLDEFIKILRLFTPYGGTIMRV